MPPTTYRRLALLGMGVTFASLLVIQPALGAPPRTSALGESCAKTGDCDSPLRCVKQACVEPVKAPPALLTEGATCAKTVDCASPLRCVRHRCTSPGAPTVVEPLPMEPLPIEQARPWYKSVAGWVFTGIGVSLIIPGAIFLADHAQDVERAEAVGATLESNKDEIGGALLGVGLGAFVTGIVLLATYQRDAPEIPVVVGVTADTDRLGLTLKTTW